ncbi:GntR family transcriptional regulator [Arthrobacter sp. Sa2BUA2]|uniref:GntR family transcriptional regulator n=1 Tax=Arthrobacter pullicola TaxID=2762224 RepID=A0ABR8YET6_9MICC|nr:GntR family transcriptional regulator [Arthrobacter pullicola]MBD8042653.1 GntR family transcriptional regulator [Arthrobacter pullicola]
MANALLPKNLPLPPMQALGELVLSRLRHAVIAGEIARGTHLVESQLSEMFDVSRGPIRDALKQLEAEGLVESRRRGVFAIGLTSTDVDELYMIRELLEIQALRLAAKVPDGEIWASVVRNLSAMEERAAAGDPLAFARADLAFHSAIYGVAGSKRLESIWQQYEPTFAVMLELTNAEDRDLGPTCQDHIDLFTTVMAGDLERAEEMLREHLQGSRTRLSNAFSRLGND